MRKQSIRAHKKRKERIKFALIATLWIVAISMAIAAKAKSPEDTYTTAGIIERETDNGYLLTVNGEIVSYETEHYFPLGKIVVVEINGNCTMETEDDFIVCIY